MSNITFDIQARIVNWGEDLKKIQDQSSKIRLDVRVGREVSRSIQEIDAQVRRLSSNVNNKLGSDLQIEAFANKISRVDEKFIKLGKTLANVNFSDLNLEVVDKEFQDLTKELQEAQELLSRRVESGFKETISDSKNLQKAIELLNIDVKELSIQEIGQALTKGLDEATEKFNEAQKEIDNLTESQKLLREQIEKAENSKIANITDTSGMATQLLGKQEDYGVKIGLNTQEFEKFKQSIVEVIDKAGPKLEGKKEEINKILASIGGATTQEEVRNNLQKLASELSQTRQLTSLGLDQGSLKSTTAKIFEDNFDIKIFIEKFSELQNKLKELGVSDEILKTFSIDPNKVRYNFEGINEEIVRILEESKTVVKQKVEDLNHEFGNLKVQEAAQRLIQDTANSQQKIITIAQSEYTDKIKELTSRYEELEKEVTRLKELLETGRAGALENIHKVGTGISDQGKENIEKTNKEIELYKTQLQQVHSAEKAIGKLEGVVQRWFSIYAAVRMVTNAVKSVISTVKELDKTITEIAIVTDMTQDQLWKQMSSYTDMAKQYATSISGVYQVSQLYY